VQNDWFAQPYILSTFQRATEDSLPTEYMFAKAFSEKFVRLVRGRNLPRQYEK
jgi:hypothetical protein